mgnify:CR=1 FL=1
MLLTDMSDLFQGAFTVSVQNTTSQRFLSVVTNCYDYQIPYFDAATNEGGVEDCVIVFRDQGSLNNTLYITAKNSQINEKSGEIGKPKIVDLFT